MTVNEEYTYECLPWRGISAETMRFYNVSTRVDASGKPIAVAATFDNGAKQIRLVEEKKFFWQGEGSGASLFGLENFEAGGKSVTITEGWLDALSGYEILGSPVLSVRSASSARKDCTRHRDKLNSFERIYLALDSDEPGQEATQAIAGLFDFNKVYHVKLGRKDANEYLQADDADSFRRAWHSARRFLPEGIVSARADFHAIIDADEVRTGTPYPFPSLNLATDGMRPGEFILLSALEGIGKTEVIRAIEYHLLASTKHRIGTIHLEEDKARQLKGLAGYVLNCPVHLRESSVSKEETKAAVDLITEDERLHIYQHFDCNDPDVILDRIRFMASACSCKFIFLDHIGLLVSGLQSDDERRKLDYLSTKLALMVKEIDFTLVVAAHVNKEGQIRGSTYPSKVAHLWLHLDRNLIAEDPTERNLTRVTIHKNRFTGRTGPSCVLWFDPGTFKISELSVTELPT